MSRTVRSLVGALVATFLLCLHDVASAAPQIIGDAKDPRCREALGIATAAFKSTSPSVNWPIPAPSKATKLILWQKSEDISGGDAIGADTSEFLRLGARSEKDPALTFFWALRLAAGKRVVLVDQPFGWRGDIYSLYLMAPDVRVDEFRQAAAAQIAKGSFLDGLLGDPRWSPPIVLKDSRSDEIWLIDREDPYSIMGAWHVRGIAAGKLTEPCRISFGLPAPDSYGLADPALQRLPAPVRRLARKLDEALGPGLNEGTLQPTAAIRGAVASGWANVALRPWSLTDVPYNSRAEVDRDLAQWAKGNRKRTALLRRIRAIYPRAEDALARHYSGRFPNAKRLAHHAIDYMYRNYFVFPADSPPDYKDMVRRY